MEEFYTDIKKDIIKYDKLYALSGLHTAISNIPFDCFDVRINGELKLRGCKDKKYLEDWYKYYYGSYYNDIFVSMKYSEINIINRVGN